MKDVIVFAGTSEGRQLYDFCAKKGIDALFCVATDYGRKVLDTQGKDIRDKLGSSGDDQKDDKLCKPFVRAGRLSQKEMTALFFEERPRIVVDATHPYASQVTAQIRGAVGRYREAQNIEEQVYCRVRRELGERNMSYAAVFEDMERAVDYLNGTEGNILATTGSKEIDKLCKLKDYARRAYLRILPDPGILHECLERGFPAGHMICMQGPFTEGMNRAVMEQYGIRYLLTKQSGAAGGYQEKCRAAQAAGVRLVIVLPPEETEGCSVEEAEELLLQTVSK